MSTKKLTQAEIDAYQALAAAAKRLREAQRRARQSRRRKAVRHGQ